MRVIISGPRTFPATFAARRAAGHAFDAEVAAIAKAWEGAGNPIVEGVISGGAKGVDSVAPAWADANGYPFSPMSYALGREHCRHCLAALDFQTSEPACPEGHSHPQGARVTWGKLRNRLMAHRILRGSEARACVVLAIWDGMSPGTAHMIATGTRLGMTVRVIPLADVLRAASETDDGFDAIMGER